jgi:hypothetical protein
MQLLLKWPACRILGAGILVAGLSTLASPGLSQRGGPFTGLQGTWTGGGSITINTGARENIRCRVTYHVSGGGNTLQQSLRCASDSYRFDLAASVSHSGGSLSGTFSESSRGVGGRLNGRVSGNRITALAEGSGFSATLTVVTTGDRQTVTIRSPGSEVSDVSINLRKS